MCYTPVQGDIRKNWRAQAGQERRHPAWYCIIAAPRTGKEKSGQHLSHPKVLLTVPGLLSILHSVAECHHKATQDTKMKDVTSCTDVLGSQPNQ